MGQYLHYGAYPIERSLEFWSSASEKLYVKEMQEAANAQPVSALLVMVVQIAMLAGGGRGRQHAMSEVGKGESWTSSNSLAAMNQKERTLHYLCVNLKVPGQQIQKTNE